MSRHVLTKIRDNTNGVRAELRQNYVSCGLFVLTGNSSPVWVLNFLLMSKRDTPASSAFSVSSFHVAVVVTVTVLTVSLP